MPAIQQATSESQCGFDRHSERAPRQAAPLTHCHTLWSTIVFLRELQQEEQNRAQSGTAGGAAPTCLWGGGAGTIQFQSAVMGQVCFRAISSNRACHRGLHCSQFSVPDHVLCVRFPKVQWLGSGAGSLPPFSTVPGQLSPVGLWECKRSARLTPTGGRALGFGLVFPIRRGP